MTDVRSDLRYELHARIREISPRIDELDEFRLLQIHHSLDLIFRLPGEKMTVSKIRPEMEDCERCGGRRVKGTDTR